MDSWTPPAHSRFICCYGTIKRFYGQGFVDNGPAVIYLDFDTRIYQKSP